MSGNNAILKTQAAWLQALCASRLWAFDAGYLAQAHIAGVPSRKDKRQPASNRQEPGPPIHDGVFRRAHGREWDRNYNEKLLLHLRAWDAYRVDGPFSCGAEARRTNTCGGPAPPD